MCFPRKAGLGRFNASRADWQSAFREARIDARQNVSPNPQHEGVRWKAALIVAYDRKMPDPLSFPAPVRLETLRMVRMVTGGPIPGAMSVVVYPDGSMEDTVRAHEFIAAGKARAATPAESESYHQLEESCDRSLADSD